MGWAPAVFGRFLNPGGRGGASRAPRPRGVRGERVRKYPTE